MSPYPGLDAPVVVTVWGRQLRLEGADDPRLGLFIARYGAGETAPEPFASCAGGLSDPDPGPYGGGGSAGSADLSPQARGCDPRLVAPAVVTRGWLSWVGRVNLRAAALRLGDLEGWGPDPALG